MSHKKLIPICKESRSLFAPCVARRGDMCTCLDDTEFNGRQCPFYKTEAEEYDALARAFVRLIGEGYILDKYGTKNVYLSRFSSADPGSYAGQVYAAYTTRV